MRDLTEKQRKAMTDAMLIRAYSHVSADQLDLGAVHLTESPVTNRERSISEYTFTIRLPGEPEPAIKTSVHLPRESVR